jgi:D-xylose transport system substrate-binding protein
MKTTFFFLILVFLFSCSSHSGKKKIGFLIRDYKLDRCVKERDFFTQRATELGAEVICKDAGNDDHNQISQAEEMIKNGVDVLVLFAVNGQSAAQIIREAHDSKIKVIAYESLIENCDLDYFVTADNEKGGEMMTTYITQKYPTGNYIMLGGNKSDKNAVLIKEGQHKIIDPLVKSGQINVKYDIYADWDADEGYMETKKYLNLSCDIPSVILSSNDGLATGVIKALDELGLTGKIGVTGLDGELSAFQRIAKGTQSVTIFKSFKAQASAAADMAFEIANGKKPKNITAKFNNKMVDVPTFLLQPVVVDAANLNEVIVKGGVFSEQEVYGAK